VPKSNTTTSAPRVLFIRFAPWMIFQNNHPHDLMWPCSLLYDLETAKRCGFEAEIMDLHVEELDEAEIVTRCTKAPYDLIFIDTMTPTMALARSVATKVKQERPDTIIWGIGQHPSEKPDDLLYKGSAFTGVLLGEHEETIKQVFSGNTEPGFWGSAGLDEKGELTRYGDKAKVLNVDDLPEFTPAGIHIARYQLRSASVPSYRRPRWGFLLTSRGCPFPCIFCSATLRQSYGRDFRPHGAQRVVSDMVRLYKDFGINTFYMIDDVFTLDKQRVQDIADGLIRENLPISWVIQTRGDMLSAAMCKHLKRAGCVGVKIGIESGVPRILKLIKKNAKPETLVAAADAVRDAGLSLTAYYMLGHPTETQEEMEETFRFAKRINADMIQVGFHTPYPGSETFELYKDQIEDLSELHHYETQHVNLSQVDGKTLERLQREFYLRYYFSPNIFGRYVKNRLMYRGADPEEWKLAASSLRYLLSKRGRVGLSETAPRPLV
jgi:anaerobic magnesium-protoporphyrin IX monomethyl ester cyclase